MCDPIHTNALRDLLLNYPDGIITYINSDSKVQWDYFNLSYNPSLPSDFVRDNLDKNWYFKILLTNKNLDSEIRLLILEGIISPVDIRGWEDKIILDLPILKYILEETEDLSTLNTYNAMSFNPNFTLEAIQWLYTSEYKEYFDWDDIQSVSSIEIIEWIFSEHSDLINPDHLLKNKNLTDSIIDRLISEHEISLITLLEHNYLSNQKQLDLIRSDQFDIGNTELVYKILTHGCVEVAREILKLRYDILCQEVSIDYIRLVSMDGQLDLIKQAKIPDDALLEVVRTSDIPNLLTQIKDHYINCHHQVNRDILRQLRDRGHNLEYIHPLLEELMDNQDLEIYLINKRGKLLCLEINKTSTLEWIISKISLPEHKRQIIIKIEPTDEFLEYLSTHQKYLNYMDWFHLTTVTHQDLILKYPKLYWKNDVIATRLYYPSTRFMKTKAAK